MLLLLMFSIILISGCIGEDEADTTPTGEITKEPKEIGTEKTTALVLKVVDGDTIELQNGQKVRLLSPMKIPLTGKSVERKEHG